MDSKQKEVFFEQYNTGIHRLGRAGLIIALTMLIGAPFAMGLVLGAMPDMNGFVRGFIQVAAVYLPVSIVEFLIYSPMLGAGGSYLSFITGNLTNLKIPCAVNARDICETEIGTPENEIVSTLSVATSALVTTVVVATGVLLMVPLQPVLSNPVLAPAFDNVVAALFGALACKYYIKGWKVAVLPLLLMSLLCIFLPAAIPQVGFLMIAAGLIAIGISYILFKKDKL